MAKGHAGLVGVRVGAQRCCTVTGIVKQKLQATAAVKRLC